MPDLSEWAWVIVVGVWFLAKTVARLFRSKSDSPKAVQRAPAERAPERFGEEGEGPGGDIAPTPIQPK